MPYSPASPDPEVKQKVEQLDSHSLASLPQPPQVNAIHYLCNGQKIEWKGKTEPVESCVCYKAEDGKVKRVNLGVIHSVNKDTALELLEAAHIAFNYGRGHWPCATVDERLKATESFVNKMVAVREQVITLLMWEIGKNRKESENEFDRTVIYIKDTIRAVRTRNNSDASFQTAEGHIAQIRRSPLGVVLSMGPFNYPLNETFTTLIPAVIMGNTCVVKLPRHGALCITPLIDAFATCYPPGVVNIFNGRGVDTAGPIIESGKVNSLAFIGSSSAANRLRIQHPKPSRLRCSLGLDAKNAAIILEDATIDSTIDQILAGTLGFAGQRCTAIKIVFVHEKIADKFVEEFSKVVDSLKFGFPWDKDAFICPLPEYNKITTLQGYVDDAVSKGARVCNRNGGLVSETFYFPSVVYPVTNTMKLWTIEQFGPVVPVVRYSSIDDVIEYLVSSTYGQQVSVFGNDPSVIGPLCDILVNQVCRVNLNGACKRGPDVFPFTARKDSAEGTLDIESAIRTFSIRTMVAAPITEQNRRIIRSVITERSSQFLNNDILF